MRRCPKRSSVDTITGVYAQMLAAERAAGARDAIAAGTKVLVDVLKQTGKGYEELVFAI